MRCVARLSLLALGLVCWGAGPDSAEAGSWRLRNGEAVAGEPVAFDFAGKTLTFHDSIADRETTVATRDLSLRSRQKLLFSPLFHQGEKGASLWPPAKRKLALAVLALPMVVLFFFFWSAAWFFTGKFNPFFALMGFFGSWIILGIFLVCYAFLEIRFDGGLKILLLGAVVALAVTPLYLSAVYNCSYGKAHLVLLTHLVAGFCVLTVAFAAIEVAAGSRLVETWWDTQVFEPLGLMPAPDPLPQRDR